MYILDDIAVYMYIQNLKQSQRFYNIDSTLRAPGVPVGLGMELTSIGLQQGYDGLMRGLKDLYL